MCEQVPGLLLGKPRSGLGAWPDAVHYFPVHMYGDDEPVRGGRAIGEKWARSVQT